MIKLKGYMYKKGFVWIGWLIRERRETLYYDNKPLEMPIDDDVVYLTFGFNKAAVMERIIKKKLKFT